MLPIILATTTTSSMLGPGGIFGIIAALAVGVLGSGGVLGFIAARSQVAWTRTQADREAAKKDRQWSRSLEDYADRLRKQLLDANITPEEWPRED